jgi:hypothetical protein
MCIVIDLEVDIDWPTANVRDVRITGVGTSETANHIMDTYPSAIVEL